MINQVAKWFFFRAAIYVGVALVSACLFFAVVAIISAHAKWDRVAGEWEQYRLNETQMNWFKSVRSKKGVPCCNISDGHPTEMKRLDDGIYIPDPLHTDGPWLRVPDEAMTMQGNNPVGVATVWYVVQTSQDNQNIHIRCFVPESET